MILTANLRVPSNHIHRDMARKSRRAKLQASLRTPTGSPLPLCGGEHGPEMPHREGGAAGASARCGSGGSGSRGAGRGPRRKSRPPCPRLPLGLWVDVGVDVRGHRRARVPQAARRGPHVAPARHRHRGEGVPGVVERAAKAVHPAEGREVLAEPSWVAGQAPSPRVPGVQGSPRATPVSCATRSASWRLAESVVSRCLVSAYPSALMSHIQEDTPSAERPARRTFRVQGSIWRAPAVATPSAARAGRLLSGSCWDSRCSRRLSRRA